MKKGKWSAQIIGYGRVDNEAGFLFRNPGAKTARGPNNTLYSQRIYMHVTVNRDPEAYNNMTLMPIGIS